LRAIMNRYPVRSIYVAFGVAFHVLLALTLRLGIFPYSMLAFFPAFFRPDEIEAFFTKIRVRLSKVRASTTNLPDTPAAAP
jgi:hypothetical protein